MAYDLTKTDLPLYNENVLKKGLIHIYYGDGSGKSAAAIGHGTQAAGLNSTVCLVRFFKGGDGKADALKQLDGFFVVDTSSVPFCSMNEKQRLEYAPSALKLFHQVLIEAAAKDYDMLILDEALNAVTLNIIPEDDLLTFLSFKPFKLEVVLTGANITPRLCACADRISYITKNIRY